jgi:hypothetical protein
MMEIRSKRRLAGWPLAALLAFGMVFAGANQSALANDEDEAFDTKIIRGFLRSLGLRNGNEAGIEYRERSPLVVPPSRALPSPETTPATAANPAWPLDVDIKRDRERRTARRNAKTIEEESLPELPSELNRVGRATRTPAGQTPTGGPADDPLRPSTPNELGSKSLFTWGSLWGQPKEEYATFTREPSREALTQPPAGYRTPSPSQPYGVGKEKFDPKAINPMDTPAMRGE